MRFGGIMLTADEVAKHNSRRSCWVIIAGQAYDVTDFLDNHPGGPSIILRYAGIVSFAIIDIELELINCRTQRRNTSLCIQKARLNESFRQVCQGIMDIY